MKIFNGHEHLVSLSITDGNTTDGIHIQPYGRVKLPSGWQLTGNSIALNPKVQVGSEPGDVVAQPTVAVKPTK